MVELDGYRTGQWIWILQPDGFLMFLDQFLRSWTDFLNCIPKRKVDFKKLVPKIDEAPYYISYVSAATAHYRFGSTTLR